MVVDDVHVMSIAVVPDETQPVLVVDARKKGDRFIFLLHQKDKFVPFFALIVPTLQRPLVLPTTNDRTNHCRGHGLLLPKHQELAVGAGPARDTNPTKRRKRAPKHLPGTRHP